MRPTRNGCETRRKLGKFYCAVHFLVTLTGSAQCDIIPAFAYLKSHIALKVSCFFYTCLGTNKISGICRKFSNYAV